MPERYESPYATHVFVCTNDRGGERKSCADNDSPSVKTLLKEAVNARGWKGRVRVSTSGCMGLCAKGSNVILYPQRIWFSGVLPEDVEKIVGAIAGILGDV